MNRYTNAFCSIAVSGLLPMLFMVLLTVTALDIADNASASSPAVTASLPCHTTQERDVICSDFFNTLISPRQYQF